MPLLAWPLVLTRRNLNLRTKSPKRSVEARKSLYLRPGDLPTISPFSADQRLVSPSQPVRSLPLKRGRKAGSAALSAGAAGPWEQRLMTVANARQKVRRGIENPPRDCEIVYGKVG